MELVHSWQLGNLDDDYGKFSVVDPHVERMFLAELLPSSEYALDPRATRHVQTGPQHTPWDVRPITSTSDGEPIKKFHRHVRVGTRIKFGFAFMPIILPTPQRGQWISLAQIHGYKEPGIDETTAHQAAQLRCYRDGHWQLSFRVRGDRNPASGSYAEHSNPGVFASVSIDDCPIEIGQVYWVFGDFTFDPKRPKSVWQYAIDDHPAQTVIDTDADNYFASQMFRQSAGKDVVFGLYRDRRLADQTIKVLYQDCIEAWYQPEGSWPIV